MRCVCVQDTICQCKQLRLLNLGFEPGEDDYVDAEDASLLLVDLIDALPNLATLHWEESAPVYASGYEWECTHAFSARKESPESPAGSGLRLLHAEKCTFEGFPELPASLQTLSLCNRLSGCYPLPERLDLLLAPCAALSELYILLMHKSEQLDLPAIAAACPGLRVLVLSVLVHRTQTVRPSCTLPSDDKAVLLLPCHQLI